MSQQQGNALSLAVGAHDTTCHVPTFLFYAVVVAAAKRALALHEDVVRRQK